MATVVGRGTIPIPSDKLTWLAGKPPLLIGNTSSNGGFPIAMLLYRSVYA